MEALLGKTKIVLKKGDITREEVDSIVNAANSRLLGGGGVDGAIHRAAGPSLLQECRKIGWCDPGEAVITRGGNLRARYVVHTVGPVWQGGTRGEERVLASAFKKSLERAMEKGARTIAFPAVSTGAYGFPVDLAARTSLCSVKEFLEAHPDAFEEIRLVLFNDSMLQAFERAFISCFGK
jgi:O-acetyl-ADP-ribose deacetylase (regulator of RNase III)